MNRVWICMRRLRMQDKQLEKYKEKLRFKFIKNPRESYSKLVWNNSDGQNIKIESPLHKYIELQRKEMNISKDWNQHLGNICAKDFAILARFKDSASAKYTSDGYLQDIFISGIRGLGTWGAAWFIDRESHHFNKFSDLEDIQMLLEVRYSREGITAVLDVSDMSQEYFQNENKIEVIDKYISREC